MNSRKQPRVRIWLSIVGEADWDPDVLGTRLGAKPDKSWLLDDHVPGTALRRKDSRWIFEQGPKETWDAGDAAEEFIFGQASKIVEQLKNGSDIKKCHSIEFAIQVTAFEALPSIVLSQRLIDALGKIGALVDVDIVLSE